MVVQIQVPVQPSPREQTSDYGGCTFLQEIRYPLLSLGDGDSGRSRKHSFKEIEWSSESLRLHVDLPSKCNDKVRVLSQKEEFRLDLSRFDRRCYLLEYTDHRKYTGSVGRWCCRDHAEHRRACARRGSSEIGSQS
jgi:hypothetical protein